MRPQGLNCKKVEVIKSGANKKIFFSTNLKDDVPDTFKVVTHHWGANWNKGFEIYEKLDELLGKEEYKSKFSFTYIGNVPSKFKFKNTK